MKTMFGGRSAGAARTGGANDAPIAQATSHPTGKRPGDVAGRGRDVMGSIPSRLKERAGAVLASLVPVVGLGIGLAVGLVADRGFFDPQVEPEGLHQPIEAGRGDRVGGPHPDSLAGVLAPEAEV